MEKIETPNERALTGVAEAARRTKTRIPERPEEKWPTEATSELNDGLGRDGAFGLCGTSLGLETDYATWIYRKEGIMLGLKETR